MDQKQIDIALRHYEAVKRASNNYYARKKQAKIEAGTYKGRGRPRKVAEVKTESV